MPKLVPNSVGERILTNAQDTRPVIQEFVPLAQSLEWELGQQYFRERGNKAFISDTMPVPFVINNDGTLSRNAAEVLFASLVEAEKEDLLENEIFVLEIGIGVGLFARFFLDHFRELCVSRRQDFYDRLCYVAADRSVRMLHDLLRHGVLNDHVGHFCTCPLDAMSPAVANQGANRFAMRTGCLLESFRNRVPFVLGTAKPALLAHVCPMPRENR